MYDAIGYNRDMFILHLLIGSIDLYELCKIYQSIVYVHCTRDSPGVGTTL